MAGLSGPQPLREQDACEEGEDRQQVIADRREIGSGGGQRHQDDIASLGIGKDAAAGQVGVGIEKAADKGERESCRGMFMAGRWGIGVEDTHQITSKWNR